LAEFSAKNEGADVGEPIRTSRRTLRPLPMVTMAIRRPTPAAMMNGGLAGFHVTRLSIRFEDLSEVTGLVRHNNLDSVADFMATRDRAARARGNCEESFTCQSSERPLFTQWGLGEGFM